MSAGPSTFLFTLANVTNTGAPQMAVYYAMALRKRGHRVHLAHGGNDNEVAASRIVEDMLQAGVSCTHLHGLSTPVQPSLPSRVAAVAGSECRTVVGFTQRDRCVALLAAQRLGIPGVLSVQNQHVFNGPFPIAWLKERYYRKTVRRYCSLALCTSQIVIDEFSDRFGVDPARLELLPNGIDVERFRPANRTERSLIRARYQADDDAEVLLAVGRLEPQKGILDLIDAFARIAAHHPSARLWIAGGISSGSAKRRSSHYARSIDTAIDRSGLGHRIRMLGEVADIPALHTAADVYVHPARWEGWPLALMEAMAAAKPSVFTDCFGSLTDFEQGQHGYRVPTADIERFADALRVMLSRSRREREQIGQAGRKLVCRHYSIEKLSSRFVDYLERQSA